MTDATKKSLCTFCISDEEKKFLEDRAKKFKNIKERLEWIEAAWQMIQTAKKSLNETIRRP